MPDRHVRHGTPVIHAADVHGFLCSKWQRDGTFRQTSRGLDQGIVPHATAVEKTAGNEESRMRPVSLEDG